MKLEQLYNEKGEKRPYLLGEDGREYFFTKTELVMLFVKLTKMMCLNGTES